MNIEIYALGDEYIPILVGGVSTTESPQSELSCGSSEDLDDLLVAIVGTMLGGCWSLVWTLTWVQSDMTVVVSVVGLR